MRTPKKHIQGNAMLVILMVVAILSAAVAGALNLTSSLTRNVNRTSRYREAVAIGDGALDYLFVHWYTKAGANANAQLTGGDYNDFALPTADMFPTIEAFEASKAKDDTKALSNLSIVGLNPKWEELGAAEAVPASHGMNLGARSYFYKAKADVTLRNINGDPVRVQARRVFEKEIGSPWMYAIFYTDLLEIHPGPEFHVTGWVHTNDKLYTAHNELFFESKVTAVKTWEDKAYAPNDGHHATDVKENANWIIEPQDGAPYEAPMGMKKTEFDPNSDNQKGGYRELIERPSTTGESKPEIESQRYYNQADVKVLVDGYDTAGKPVVTIKDRAGNTLKPTDTGVAGAIYNTFINAVTTTDRIEDNREGGPVRLVSLDMAKVNTAMQSTGALYGKLNGVIYVSDSTWGTPDGVAGDEGKRGVRLRNGATMPPGGLTVVSDNPVYIQGDYNTGTTSTLKPDSNQPNGDPNKNTVTGYKKQSSAVIGDAVMILSNAWTDAKSTAKVADRKASPTTVNAAIISGIVPTGKYGNNYSGGAENFPRFMETWGSGNTFTYHGSMVQLYQSEHATGAWGQPNVYDPPKRKWFFDRQFYTDPPPGTLNLITFKKGRWYQGE